MGLRLDAAEPNEHTVGARQGVNPVLGQSVLKPAAGMSPASQGTFVTSALEVYFGHW